MIRVKDIIKIVSVLIIIMILGFSCGPAKPQIIKAQKFVPVGELGNRQEKSNVIIEVLPVDETNYDQFPELTPVVQWIEQGIMGPITKKGKVYLFGKNVQFRVSVTNRTGHVLRFTGTVIKCIDDMGNVNDAYLKSSVLAIHADNSIIQYQLKAPLEKIRYLDQNVEVLPDMTWTGYIVFPLKWEDVAETFKFVIYDLITKTDEAGNVKEKSRFEFNFKKEIVEKTK